MYETVSNVVVKLVNEIKQNECGTRVSLSRKQLT